MEKEIFTIPELVALGYGNKKQLTELCRSKAGRRFAFKLNGNTSPWKINRKKFDSWLSERRYS